MVPDKFSSSQAGLVWARRWNKTELAIGIACKRASWTWRSLSLATDELVRWFICPLIQVLKWITPNLSLTQIIPWGFSFFCFSSPQSLRKLLFYFPILHNCASVLGTAFWLLCHPGLIYLYTSAGFISNLGQPLCKHVQWLLIISTNSYLVHITLYFKLSLCHLILTMTQFILKRPQDQRGRNSPQNSRPFMKFTNLFLVLVLCITAQAPPTLSADHAFVTSLWDDEHFGARQIWVLRLIMLPWESFLNFPVLLVILALYIDYKLIKLGGYIK